MKQQKLKQAQDIIIGYVGMDKIILAKHSFHLQPLQARPQMHILNDIQHMQKEYPFSIVKRIINKE